MFCVGPIERATQNLEDHMNSCTPFTHPDLSKVLDFVNETYNGYGHAVTRGKVYDQLCALGNASLFYGTGDDLFSVHVEFKSYDVNAQVQTVWFARVVPARV